MLGTLSQEKIDELASDQSFLSDLDDVYARFALSEKQTLVPRTRRQDNAYFSMEYGLDVSLPRIRAAWACFRGSHEDRERPWSALVGVGLLYRQGYFNSTSTPMDTSRRPIRK
jgi:starch phosphorylase